MFQLLRNRRFTRLAVVVLLAVQVLPAYAVCACEHPEQRSCCASPTRQVEADPVCCSSKSQSAGGIGLDEQVVSAHGCQKALVVADGNQAVRPTASKELAYHAPTLTALTPGSAEPSFATDVVTTISLRGPPRGRSIPAYLFFASFLI